MHSIFIPYKRSRPAPLTINGHKVLIMATEMPMLEDQLERFGADHLREVKVSDSAFEQTMLFNSLADRVKGGVFLAPVDESLESVIDNLKFRLPWIN